ncbi:MAG: hypothetical protein Q9163_004342 [Psora crenata]
MTDICKLKSFLDLVNVCDNFPYYENDPEEHLRLVSSYFKLYLLGPENCSGPYGYILEWVVDAMPWDGRWAVDYAHKRVTPSPMASKINSQTEVIRDTLLRAKELKRFKVLDGWRNELYPILGHKSEVEKDISVERAASPLFGINTYGVHMTVYTYTDTGMKLWVPKRAKGKQTYGGMLDNTVAGGLSTGEMPFECLIREATEEASLSEQLVRSNAKTCGTVSYFHIRGEQAGGEAGLLQPECQYVYDMEVGGHIKPKPNDDEVEVFYLWTVDEVKRHMAMGEFKPNCALVLLDFFVRHGILTAENEPDYVEIVSRLHRKLPFPTRPSGPTEAVS